MKYLEAEHPGLYERLILNGTLFTGIWLMRMKEQ